MNCSAGLPANFRDAEQTGVALEMNQKYPDFKTRKFYAPFKNKIVLVAPQITCTFLDKDCFGFSSILSYSAKNKTKSILVRF